MDFVKRNLFTYLKSKGDRDEYENRILKYLLQDETINMSDSDSEDEKSVNLT